MERELNQIIFRFKNDLVFVNFKLSESLWIILLYRKDREDIEK